MSKKIILFCYFVFFCSFILQGCKNPADSILKSDTSDEIYFSADAGEDSAEIESAGENSDVLDSSDLSTDESKNNIVVYICGEVNNPGVYTLLEGDRLYQAIEAAGGMSEKADGTALNLAKLICDGEQIYVPKISYDEDGNPVDSASSQSTLSAASASSLVNINTANLEELMTLSGIGETKAQAIIDYRTKNGNFKRIEDIKNVSGIGDSTYSNIENNITV